MLTDNGIPFFKQVYENCISAIEKVYQLSIQPYATEISRKAHKTERFQNERLITQKLSFASLHKAHAVSD